MLVVSSCFQDHFIGIVIHTQRLITILSHAFEKMKGTADGLVAAIAFHPGNGFLQADFSKANRLPFRNLFLKLRAQILEPLSGFGSICVDG